MSQRGRQPLLVGCLGAAAIVVLTMLGAVVTKMTDPRIPIIDLIPFVLAALAVACALAVWGFIRQSTR